MADGVVKCLENSDLWPTNAAGSTIEQKIKFEVVYFSTFVVLNICLSFISGILHAIPLDGDREIFYTLATIEDYLPQWKNVLCFMYRCGFLVLPMVMAAPFYITIYICSQMRFQAYMIFHLRELLGQKLVTNITDDKKYNKIIKKILVASIQRHSRILWY